MMSGHASPIQPSITSAGTTGLPVDAGRLNGLWRHAQTPCDPPDPKMTCCAPSRAESIDHEQRLRCYCELGDLSDAAGFCRLPADTFTSTRSCRSKRPTRPTWWRGICRSGAGTSRATSVAMAWLGTLREGGGTRSVAFARRHGRLAHRRIHRQTLDQRQGRRDACLWA